MSVPRLHERVIERRAVAREPNWVTGNPMGYNVTVTEPLASRTTDKGEVEEPLHQGELLRPLYMDIAKHGLSYAYKKFGGDASLVIPRPPEEVEQTTNSKHVIIVGAGMAGLVAARELRRVGHTVTIVETQKRVGGRVKTFDCKDGFKEGLYVDAGAMRLPSAPNDTNKIHFLTDYYGEEVCELESIDFINSSENGFLKFYNKPKVQAKDWKDSNFSELWPGWDSRIRLTGAKDEYHITNIGAYYKYTTSIVTNQLRVLLVDVVDPAQRSIIWNEWTETWGRFPLDGFLSSTKDAILQQVPADFHIGLERLDKFLPWPEAAITAYSVFSYTTALDQSLVSALRGTLGQWGSANMHHYEGGMSELPKALVEKCGLEEDIIFNFTVTKIKFNSPQDDLHKEVIVEGFKRDGNGQFPTCQVTGNAVIITTPINILRQIKFEHLEETLPLPNRFYKAIEDIWYGPSTKIMIQCKKRFWETAHGIQGGFTKTNLPIGQIHYPSNPGFNTILVDEGILLCYTWKQEALLFGSLEPELAILEAVDQLAEIHPEIKEQDVGYEHGAIQAWYNEPSAQGAYAHLKPNQHEHVKWLMYPWRNIYFAGEAISFANGWIQGALESALRAAYQFYARNENLAS